MLLLIARARAAAAARSSKEQEQPSERHAFIPGSGIRARDFTRKLGYGSTSLLRAYHPAVRAPLLFL